MVACQQCGREYGTGGVPVLGSDGFCSQQCRALGGAQSLREQRHISALACLLVAVLVFFLLPSILPIWIFTSAGFGDAVEAAFGSVWGWLWSLSVWALVVALCLPRGREHLSKWLSWLKSSGVAASLYVAKQTERTKIQTVSLPQSFLALGKHVYSANSFRDDFADAFGELDGLHAKVEELESRAKSRPTGEKMTEKAKAVAASTKDRAEAQAQRLQVSRHMAKLGKAAYERHRKGSGPAELISPIEQLLSRSDVLTDEIDELSNENKGQLITPKRVAIGGVACILLIFGWAGASLLLKDSEPNTLVNLGRAENDSDLTTSISAPLPAGFRGLKHFVFFLHKAPESLTSDEFVGEELTFSGQGVSVTDNPDGGLRLDLDILTADYRAICLFRGDAARALESADANQVNLVGTYRGLADTGALLLDQCRLLTDREIAEIKKLSESVARANSDTPSRSIVPSNERTARIIDDWSQSWASDTKLSQQAIKNEMHLWVTVFRLSSNQLSQVCRKVDYNIRTYPNGNPHMLSVMKDARVVYASAGHNFETALRVMEFQWAYNHLGQ